MKTAKVYLVGAGPGKPDLITVRGLNILKEADTIIYDYLVDEKILEDAREDAELISSKKLGKSRSAFGSSQAQHRLNSLIVKKAKEGKKVIRLKNGDPSIFSRSSQELKALSKEGIDFEIVPGVSAANAASSLTGIPLTDRSFASSCVFVTGSEDPKKSKSSLDWRSLSKSGTIVLYMAVGKLTGIVKEMLEAGKDKDTPVTIIKDVSLMTQKVSTGTLRNIAAVGRKERLKPPAIIIIGKVTELEKEFNWLRRNKRILFTGLSNERFFIKGSYFHLPLIKIVPMEDYREFDVFLKNIEGFHWIVFASRYGVEHFFKRLKAVGCDSRALANIKIAAVGNSTRKRLLDFGISADLVPEKESSAGLIDKFKKIDLKNKKIFLPRSDISDKGLSKALESLGAEVSTGLAYRNVMAEDLPDLDLSFFDEIIFTSPSTVRNFKRRYKRLPDKIKVKCIGGVTLKEAKRCGYA